MDAVELVSHAVEEEFKAADMPVVVSPARKRGSSALGVLDAVLPSRDAFGLDHEALGNFVNPFLGSNSAFCISSLRIFEELNVDPGQHSRCRWMISANALLVRFLTKKISCVGGVDTVKCTVDHLSGIPTWSRCRWVLRIIHC